MDKKEQPWYWQERNGWYVIVNGHSQWHIVL